MGFLEYARSLVPFTTIMIGLIYYLYPEPEFVPPQVPSSILVRSNEVAKKLNEVSYHY